jgi:hypothetical protein
MSLSVLAQEQLVALIPRFKSSVDGRSIDGGRRMHRRNIKVNLRGSVDLDLD